MENFAENLNLGKHFCPPPPVRKELLSKHRLEFAVRIAKWTFSCTAAVYIAITITSYWFYIGSDMVEGLALFVVGTCCLPFCYARNTPGLICRYKEDGLVSRPPSLFTSMRRPMHGTSCPKSQLKSTCLTAKFGSFLDHAETGELGQNVISSSVQRPISLIFAIHAQGGHLYLKLDIIRVKKFT